MSNPHVIIIFMKKHKQLDGLNKYFFNHQQLITNQIFISNLYVNHIKQPPTALNIKWSQIIKSNNEKIIKISKNQFNIYSNCILALIFCINCCYVGSLLATGACVNLSTKPLTSSILSYLSTLSFYINFFNFFNEGLMLPFCFFVWSTY